MATRAEGRLDPPAARPFLKWAGGKAKLAPLIIERAPENFARYHEPFLGAGAAFFALAAQRPSPAILTDANAALIETFRVVRDDVDGLISALQPLADRYLRAGPEQRSAIYYEVRANPPVDSIGQAARLIFLNKTCYNGLYRENSSGGFNVPHGRYKQPGILDPYLLRICSATLSAAQLAAGDFEEACDRAQTGDFVYLDPPYHPLSATSSFTSYTAGDFGYPEQVRLRDAFDALTKRGVAAMLSNSDHEAIRELYAGQGYRVETVTMSRAINSVGSKRQPVGELLVSNFG